ncbi:MAG: FHA domain-containing protein [Nannocystaceae bacterium]|nr:FHA domain-containing protein [bacterium]
MPQFKVRIGNQTLLLPDGEHDIGRLADCWLTIDDDLASRQHARFHVAGPTAVLVDLGSRNGTFVNGKRIVGRCTLHDGDKVRVGREILVVIKADGAVDDDDDGLRRTLAPGEDTRFPSLIGQLVEKSLRVGKVKEAERYASALMNQLGAAPVDVEHPAAKACVSCLLGLAEHTAAGVWIDRVFQLHTKQDWLMEPAVVDRVRGAMDRIPRVPGRAIADYEAQLRRLQRSGHGGAAAVLAAVAEMVDAAGQR